MKKHFLSLIALLFIFLSALVSCGEDTETAQHTHSFGSWDTTRDASCTKEGLRARECSCGNVQSEEIPKTEHNYVNGTCTVCAHKSGETHTHSFSEWKTVTDSTCIAHGSKERVCSCGTKQTDTIAKKGHNYVNNVCTVCFDEKAPAPIDPREEKYNNALSLISERKYEEAYVILIELGDYKTTRSELNRLRFLPTELKEKEEINGVLEDDLTLTIIYNSQNLPEKITEQYPDGYWSSSEYTYDAKGNLICEFASDYDGWSCEFEYTYDQKGNLIKELRTDYNGNIDYTYYTYDSDGNIIKFTTTKSYEQYQTIEYTYSNGNLVKEVSTTISGSKNTVEYTYNANGNLIRKTTNGNVTEYAYDANGNLIKETGASETYTYTYDENGNLTKCISNSDYYGEWTYEYQYIYDDKGNIVEKIYTNSDGNTSIYTYDANGNLIRTVKISRNFKDIESIEYKLLYLPFEMSDEEYNDYIKEMIDH